jgi:UDP-2-acetamido-3-amino-2,3-dideoxy-glucuronate N-acetyltransferase
MNTNPFFAHETAVIDENISIGNGTKIWHFSHIQSGAIIGQNCSLGQNVNVGNNVKIGNSVKIQNNVSVYEGVELEDYVFCGPSMVFTNIKVPRSEFPQKGSKHYTKTFVKRSASIGANATIVCGVTIGEYAMIGSGAVVTKDVPAYTLVVGNPGRIVGTSFVTTAPEPIMAYSPIVTPQTIVALAPILADLLTNVFV